VIRGGTEVSVPGRGRKRRGKDRGDLPGERRAVGTGSFCEPVPGLSQGQEVDRDGFPAWSFGVGLRVCDAGADA
jgi:hypothetical protein